MPFYKIPVASESGPDQHPPRHLRPRSTGTFSSLAQPREGPGKWTQQAVFKEAPGTDARDSRNHCLGKRTVTAVSLWTVDLLWDTAGLKAPQLAGWVYWLLESSLRGYAPFHHHI